MKSKCIVFDKPFEVSIGEMDVPNPGPGQIVTKTVVTGVSTGTETRVLRGGESNDFPLVPGYENVGQVVAAGDGVTLKEGDFIYAGSSEFTGDYTKCWGGQVEYALINEGNAIAIPAGVDPKDAIYSKVGGIALHGIKRAKVNEGEWVAVVGLGLIGHLAAQNAKALGAKVIAVDMDSERLEIAEKAGFEAVINAADGDVQAKVHELSGGGVSVAVDVTGIASTVDQTAQLVYSKPWVPPYPPSPRVVILGSYTDPVSFSYHPTLFGNEPDILPSRDVIQEDLVDMLDLIATGKVKPGIIPAHICGIDGAAEAYQGLLDKKYMRVLFTWE